MEENITHPKTKSINILICNVSGAQGATIADTFTKLTEDQKYLNVYSFTTAALQSLTENKEILKNASLVFLTAGPDNNTIISLLEKKNKPYLVLPADADYPSEYKGILASADKAVSLGFSIADFAQIYSLGISMDKIQKQLDIFKNGIAKIVLKRPAVINDGIYPVTKQEAAEYASAFEDKKNVLKLMKFVPSSGAATRMFKFLNEFVADYNPEKETINAYINKKKDSSLNIFLAGIDKFPFYTSIIEYIRQKPEYAEWDKNARYYNFIKAMLLEEKFDYANKPKGILPFHTHGDLKVTPVYEHLKESTDYAASNGQSHIHFTISEEHLDGFLDAINEVKNTIEKETGVTLNFSFSYQHKQTDTIAVNMDNTPFRDEEGRLFFRPGGHGALIENLNNLDADIVFVKNIDNVSHNHSEIIALYKKALGGLLISLQEEIFSCLRKIDNNEVSEDDINTVIAFAKQKLSIDIPKDIEKYTHNNKLEYIKELLNRPVRVCGMVKNEGEPGGGPFWVKDENGRISLQIVESSQIDLDNKTQSNILSQSTHFNPVDLVCGLKDYKGNRFDLSQYVDASTGFIVQKNRMGTDVKSYELPGLWNGAMAGWITVFTEVPLETFNPVKTVNDLLKPAHQPN